MQQNREIFQNVRVLPQPLASKNLNRQSYNSNSIQNNNNNSMNIGNYNSLQNNKSFTQTNGDVQASQISRANNLSQIQKNDVLNHQNLQIMNQQNAIYLGIEKNNNSSLSPFSNKNSRHLKENSKYSTINNNINNQPLNNQGVIINQQIQQHQQRTLQGQTNKLKVDENFKERIKKLQQDKLSGNFIPQNIIQIENRKEEQNQTGQNYFNQQAQQQISQQQQQQLQNKQKQQEPPKQDFRKEIERRYQRSTVNKTFVFPRKKIGENLNSNSIDSTNSSNDTSIESIKNVTLYDLRSQNFKQNKSQRKVQRSTTDHQLGGTKPILSDSPELKGQFVQYNNNSNQNNNSIKQQIKINRSSQYIKTEGDDNSPSIQNSNKVARTHSSISKPISQNNQFSNQNQQYSSLNSKLLCSSQGQKLLKNDSFIRQPQAQSNGFLQNANPKIVKRSEVCKSANKSYDYKIQNVSTTYTTLQSKSSNQRRPQQLSQGNDFIRNQNQSISFTKQITDISPEKKSNNTSDFLNGMLIQNNSSMLHAESQNQARSQSKSQSGNKIIPADYQHSKNIWRNGRQIQNKIQLLQSKNDQFSKIYKYNTKRPDYQQNNCSQDLSNYSVSALRIQTEGSEPVYKNNSNRIQQVQNKQSKVPSTHQPQINQLTQNLFSTNQQQIFIENNNGMKKHKFGNV